jgi:hypothetical protein
MANFPFPGSFAGNYEAVYRAIEVAFDDGNQRFCEKGKR